MAYNDRPDDQSSNWRRPVTNEEIRRSLPSGPDLQDPTVVGYLFCDALGSHEEYRSALMRLVTPESVEAWGDFSEAANYFKSIPDVGFGSIADRALGDDNVAYFKLLGGVTESFQVLSDQIMIGAAVLTLVWRPEFGEWRVHGIGDPLLPERVPHGVPWVSE
ncbi:hypothetical protein AB6813_15255 [bacterium RCC_150]